MKKCLQELSQNAKRNFLSQVHQIQLLQPWLQSTQANSAQQRGLYETAYMSSQHPKTDLATYKTSS